jgi:hypothetical protein
MWLWSSIRFQRTWKSSKGIWLGDSFFGLNTEQNALWFPRNHHPRTIKKRWKSDVDHIKSSIGRPLRVLVHWEVQFVSRGSEIESLRNCNETEIHVAIRSLSGQRWDFGVIWFRKSFKRFSIGSEKKRSSWQKLLLLFFSKLFRDGKSGRS